MIQFETIEESQIGKGGYSSVFLCRKKCDESKKLYAIKISEDINNTESSKNSLTYEYKVMKFLHGGIGIPKVYTYGKKQNKSYLVMQLLGQSLSEEIKSQNYKLKKNIFINIANQMLSRVEFLHGKGFIHCDLKPENFVFGKEKHSSTIFLIDFGLSEPYINLKTKEHKKYSEKGGHKGTLYFCSINSHMGLSLSRRDDLESLAYCYFYLWSGELPWSRISASSFDSESSKQIMNLKIEVSSQGSNLQKDIPQKLILFLDYVLKLKFTQLPDYKYLKNLLKEI